jgi:two-component system, NtrC family, sensor kinase
MKKSFSLSLFWKFTIAIAATIALLGSINLYFIYFAVYDLFEKELTRHGNTMAIRIAERSVTPILYDDLATLNTIVSENKEIDGNISYIFILDADRNILAHTFEDGVPAILLKANLPNEQPNSIVFIKDSNNPGSVIRDMAIPILDGHLGMIRMGLNEESYTSSIRKTTRVFLLMVLLFLIFGIIGSFILSYIITTPIKIISNTADKLNLDTLQVLDFQKVDIKHDKSLRLKNLLNIQDEIDILISKFYEMVSRLQNTYKELQVTQISLFQSEKMASLGALSAGIAHEINNPIAGIQNCVRRISEAPDNIKQNTQYLEMMSEAVDRIEKVVGGILNYSRKHELVLEKVNLKDIINSVLLLSAYQLEKSHIQITKVYPPEVPLVSASANHIEQVVLNLLINSIDAINEKMQNDKEFTGEIEFMIWSDPNNVGLEISDNGVGVPKDQLTSIFDPFFTLKKVRQGTGLGLSVCYNIIQQHKGKIIANLKRDGGMSFAITLPLA